MESLDKDLDKVDKYEEYIFVERRRYGMFPDLAPWLRYALTAFQTSRIGITKPIWISSRNYLQTFFA